MFSIDFIQQVIKKLDKIDPQRLYEFIFDLSGEREFFERILESMVEAVIVFDNFDNVSYVNKMAKLIFGISDKFLPPKPLKDVCKNEILYSTLDKLISEKQKLINHEIKIEFPQERVLQLNKYPMVIEDKVQGTILIFMDITLQKEEQERLHQAESLASLTTLAAGVAHEIKNPLGAIDLHIQILQRLTKDIPEDKRQDFLNIIGVIDEEIERLDGIVKNFLFTVRPLQIEQEVLDMKDLLEDLISFLEPQLDEKNINLNITTSADVPPIKADGKYIRPAFLNIIKNSCEACADNCKIEIDISFDDRDVIITITDNGKGISEEERKKIFQPYYTTKEAGTGLGLTIVHKIIKEHGGTIDVKSEENKGTSFIVRLPRLDVKTKLIES